MRSYDRKNEQMRPISFEKNYSLNSDGSCLVKFGNTHVLCCATIEDNIPKFLKNKGQGWITAEYSLLPTSTHQRAKREAVAGKQTARTQEIQRLIGRSLRSIVDLKLLGERQILIDCDVLNADGGTRTAAITGSYMAIHYAVSNLMDKKILNKNPIVNQIAAVSCGIVNGEVVVDLDYLEDSNAEVDANFVMNSNGQFIEIQATAESRAFNEEQLNQMLNLAKKSLNGLFLKQNKAILNI